MHIAYCGNFEPPHSTENHIARALENNGHMVRRLQEDEVEAWHELNHSEIAEHYDVVLWTHTQSLGPDVGRQLQMLFRMRNVGIPTVGVHLDIWHGLDRAHLLATEPFFRCQYVFTADGGHQDEFKARGINHFWFPPGVSRDECEPGTFREEFASPIAFVGSWQGGYHEESRHRHELVDWLGKNFRRDCAFWPKLGEPAIRGQDLRDLYASTQVNVGDSCFTGTGLANYWSDRIPETLGRGGYLIHPEVRGMLEQGFEPDTMGVWHAFNWEDLGEEIERALAHPGMRRDVAQNGRELVLARHTYEIRMEQVFNQLRADGAL